MPECPTWFLTGRSHPRATLLRTLPQRQSGPRGKRSGDQGYVTTASLVTCSYTSGQAHAVADGESVKMRTVIRSARYALLALVVLFTLTGCGAGASTPATPSAATTEVLSAQEQAFVARARKVVPRLVGDDERLAARGANTCDSAGDGRPEAAVVDQAVQRFSSGSYQVTRGEAQQLVAAARATVCVK
ncbi:hypothetical protein GCM10009836_49810 [Pseudonocardia ailaonensis]|uniref:DUF732 domain-containing protein n=1 Tax=Pseudonocardia ailaonensis TaxID=367279 RepID=A0ABN2NF48_9PSEU